MISMMPALKNLVADVAVGPDTANRSSIKKKRYPGGFLNLVGANSMAGLSSRPVPVVIMDEVDAALRATRGASNPTKLASARTTAFFDRKEIFLSSPSNDADETGILQMWEDSSRGRLETQCPNPECQHWQVLEFERMDLDAVKLSCVQCGEAFSQWQWNGQGEECERWAFENPNHPTTAGFRLSGLNSPWLDWKTDLVDEYKEAKRLADEQLGDGGIIEHNGDAPQ
jgi:phage terminase large subunit GpA-like protein